MPTNLLYIIMFGEHEYYKIGVSSDPKTRLRVLQTAAPLRLQIIVEIPLEIQTNVYGVEKEIHKTLREHKTYGEWFQAPLLTILKGIEDGIVQYGKNQTERLLRVQKRISRKEALAEVLHPVAPRPLPQQTSKQPPRFRDAIEEQIGSHLASMYRGRIIWHNSDGTFNINHPTMSFTTLANAQAFVDELKTPKTR